jgi:hypothetical protein
LITIHHDGLTSTLSALNSVSMVTSAMAVTQNGTNATQSQQQRPQPDVGARLLAVREERHALEQHLLVSSRAALGWGVVRRDRAWRQLHQLVRRQALSKGPSQVEDLQSL